MGVADGDKRTNVHSRYPPPAVDASMLEWLLGRLGVNFYSTYETANTCR